MSHIKAPTRDPVIQTNTSTTQQIARAENLHSPNSTAISTNTASIEQTNSLSGPTGTGSDHGTIQANHSTTLQFAIAVNYDSPDSTAIATNINFTEQVNELTGGGMRHGGAIFQVNDNSVVQIDIALNIDSPNAVAIADNTNVTEQANELTTGHTSHHGNVVQANSSSTTEFGIALDINSPGAIALANNSSTTIQVNLLETLLGDLGQQSFIGGTHGAGPSFGADHHNPNHGGFGSSQGTMALASNDSTFVQEYLLGALLHEVGLSFADLGLPDFISGTQGAGRCSGADQHEPNHGCSVMPHSTSHFADQHGPNHGSFGTPQLASRFSDLAPVHLG
jgi:hypothetical protein